MSGIKGRSGVYKHKPTSIATKKKLSWKGGSVGYGQLHRWIDLKLGKPKFCDQCKSTKKKKYEWANIDHKYKRNLKDWKRLCTSCHRNYDYKNHLLYGKRLRN